MIPFDDYAGKFNHARLERNDGVLVITLHTDGGALRWGKGPHGELGDVFHMVAQDRDNRVVILTGTGDEFSGPRPDPAARKGGWESPVAWDRTMHHGRDLLQNLLKIEVPMIAAVNGPALRHSEIPLLCDIVLASDTACFQDSGHFTGGLMPGDGVHIVYPMLLGVNRARYFLLTGEIIGAAEAKQLGLVAEVLPPEKLMPRAFEHAAKLAAQPTLMLRYTRAILTEHLKRQVQDLLGYGLALEGLVALDR